MDLNKHIMDDHPIKPFHSNGYADVAAPGRVGSTSSESFNQRRQIEFNRRVVGGYNRSSIGSAYGVLRAKAVGVGNDFVKPIAPQLRQFKGVNDTPNSQPKPQQYNPFA